MDGRCFRQSVGATRQPSRAGGSDRPGRAGFSSLAFGAAVLRRGQNLVWFAEGERSPTGTLQPFKLGVGMLLRYYRVPVVPVFIRGTFEAMLRGQFLRRLEQVTVTFGEPFDTRSLHETARPQEQVVEAVRERVAELGGRQRACEGDHTTRETW